MKRGILSLLAFSVLLSSLLIMSKPEIASAWSGDLPNCATGSSLLFEWKDKIKAKNSAFDVDNWTGSLLIATFDNVEEYQAGYTGTKYDLMVYFGYSGQFQQVSTTRSFTMNNVTGFHISKDVTNSIYYQKDVYMDSSTYNINSNSFGCILTARNVTYSSTYNGWVYSDAIPSQATECTGFDPQCYLKSALNSVNNTIRDVVRATIALFIPTKAQVTSEFDRIRDFYSEKLGFLTYPATFLSDAKDALTNSGNSWCNSNSCVLALGNFFGSPVNIDFLTVQQINTQLWGFILIFIRAGTVLWLIEKLHDEYMEVVKS